MRNQLLFSLLLFVILPWTLMANNLVVSNVGLIGRNTSAGPGNAANFAFVRFDVSWDNSWRTSGAPNNWDAAWVFIKYQLPSGQWSHATIDLSSASAPSGATISPSSDGKGIFIYRSADGSGSVDFQGERVRWNYGLDGVSDTAQLVIKVFAVEMVYVPAGAFYVGSGGTESGSLTNGSWTSGNTIPLQITSENSLTIAQSAGSLWGTSTGNTINTIGGTGSLASGFPKGYKAFYCMKYSTSQKQYVDFLNTLTYTQQASRTAVSPASAPHTPAMYSGAQAKDRNGIQLKNSGVSSSVPAVYACNLNDDSNFDNSDDGLDISCAWLSWGDGIAYAAWAALRPMTELEFEKACRGPNAAVANENVWGDTTYQNDASYVNPGTVSEAVLPSTAKINAGHPTGSTFGPTRAGIFAAGTTGRVQSGATYYGIMDMGGDVWERIVSVGSSTGVNAGRSYLGSHGNGSLSASGDAVGNADWPGTDAVGSGFRAGCWQTVAGETQTSDRTVGAFVDATRGGTNGTRGFRCVRSAQ